jgi:hypothetical protein
VHRRSVRCRRRGRRRAASIVSGGSCVVWSRWDDGFIRAAAYWCSGPSLWRRDFLGDVFTKHVSDGPRSSGSSRLDGARRRRDRVHRAVSPGAEARVREQHRSCRRFSVRRPWCWRGGLAAKIVSAETCADSQPRTCRGVASRWCRSESIDSRRPRHGADRARRQRCSWRKCFQPICCRFAIAAFRGCGQGTQCLHVRAAAPAIPSVVWSEPARNLWRVRRAVDPAQSVGGSRRPSWPYDGRASSLAEWTRMAGHARGRLGLVIVAARVKTTPAPTAAGAGVTTRATTRPTP